MPGRPLPPLVGAGAAPGAAPPPVLDAIRKGGEDRAAVRDKLAERELKDAKGDGKALEAKETLEKARRALGGRAKDEATTGKLGVDLALQTEQLRGASRVGRAAMRTVQGRSMLEVGGVWVDEGFTAKTETIVVKSMSEGYFRLLEKHPELKKVFALGNHLVWITPSGKALVLDASHGKDKVTDAEIKALFTK